MKNISSNNFRSHVSMGVGFFYDLTFDKFLCSSVNQLIPLFGLIFFHLSLFKAQTGYGVCPILSFDQVNFILRKLKRVKLMGKYTCIIYIRNLVDDTIFRCDSVSYRKY